MGIGKKFDQIAEKYDTPDKLERSDVFVKTILKHIPVKKNFKVLDVGAGTGTLDIILSAYVEKIYACDLSEGMLSVFRSKIEKMGIKNIKIFKKDIFNDDINIKDFSLVITSMTLHHIEDTFKFVSKLSSYLKNGGYLVVFDLEKEDGTFHSDSSDVKHFGFERSEVENMFRSAGLEFIDYQTAYTIEKDRNGRVSKYPVFFSYGRKSLNT